MKTDQVYSWKAHNLVSNANIIAAYIWLINIQKIGLLQGQRAAIRYTWALSVIFHVIFAICALKRRFFSSKQAGMYGRDWLIWMRLLYGTGCQRQVCEATENSQDGTSCVRRRVNKRREPAAGAGGCHVTWFDQPINKSATDEATGDRESRGRGESGFRQRLLYRVGQSAIRI